MEFIITADELKPRLAEFFILDARKREEYEAAHVEGAAHLPGNILLKEGVELISQESFGALMSCLGIIPDTKIAVYDNGNGRPAARLWFVAKHFGHKNVVVVDGGWPCASVLPQSDTEPKLSPTNYVPALTEGYIVTTQDILDNFDCIKLLDVRTSDEFRGFTMLDNPRGGHIPGAIHIEHSYFLDSSPEKSFISTEKIVALLSEAGINKDDFIVPY